MKLQKHAAFSLVEVMMVVVIMLVLAGLAFSSARTVVQPLQLNNAFSRVVLMVENARNLARTAKENAPAYGLLGTIGLNSTATVFIDRNGDSLFTDASEKVEDYPFTGTNYELFSTDIAAPSPLACTSVRVLFKKSTGDVTMFCNDQASTHMRIGVSERAVPGQTPAQKRFTLHQGSGIPQIE